MKQTTAKLALLAFAFSSLAPLLAADAKEVNALIRCHEGKFDAMNAVSQLTKDINPQDGKIGGWSGIGAYPDGHMEGESVFVSAPYTISAPVFVTVKDTTWACVTVQKQ